MYTLRSIGFARVMTVLALGLYVVIPVVAFAQGISKQIVPCAGALPSGSLPACNTCHIAELAQNLINFGVMFTVFAAAVLFAYAGFLYLTAESFGKIDKAHKLFLNVTIGLIVILSAWLVVDIIMKAFMGDNAGGFGPWNNVCRALPNIS